MKEKNNKKIYVISIIFIVIIILISACFFMIEYNKNTKILGKKLALLEQKYFRSENIEKIKKNKLSTIIVSVGDNKKQAIVRGGEGEDFQEVYNEVKEEIQNTINELRKKY